ncbi:hypothetical protein [Paenibacillus lemnae]|uniref:hypothetical protein n=1 Tax=Paenibacillus lemnae TaxID=1330551 RepID=UPI001FE9E042|nr:hypothetical protein [Paenibacillus lemnae]
MRINKAVIMMTVSGISTEERSLIKSYLFLRFIHRVFERDCRIIQESGIFKTPELYVELVGSGAKKTAVLLKEIKQEFKSRSMKVFEISRSPDGVEAHYSCRGYVGCIEILWPSFQQEMMTRMRAYLGLTHDFTDRASAADPIPSAASPFPAVH